MAPTASALRERLLADGFVAVRDALDPAAVQAVRDAMAALDLDAGPSGYGRIVHDTWRHSAALGERLLRGPLPALAAEALGEAPVLFQDHLVDKTPGTVSPVRWHQDYSYWPLADARGVTMWVALDEAYVENGCLHYVPGTHRLGERQPADFIAGAHQPMRAQLPPLDVDPGAAVAIPARAGDVLLHDPLTWHFSPGNRSGRPRRAWSISWVTASARWDPDHAPHPYLWTLAPVRGAALDPERFPRVSGGAR